MTTTPQEIIDQHIEIFKSQRREGVIAKFMVLFLLIIAFVFSYFDIIASFDTVKPGTDIREEQVVPAIAIACAFFAILLFFSKSINFVFPAKLKSAKRKYKQAIYDLIISEHPEIVEYMPDHRISPKEFCASGLFNTRYEDYKGDDWLKAYYREHKIVMCELKVSRLFERIFKGFFVKCGNIDKSLASTIVFNNLNPSSDDTRYFSADTIRYIADYCTNHESVISITTVNQTLYIGIERNRNIFERSDLKAIKNLSEDFEIFSSNFEIVKCIIRDME